MIIHPACQPKDTTMSLRVRKLITPFNAPEYTHFIRIPLLNQSSALQVQNTLWRVANDPVSASIPPAAYRPLQRLNLSIASLQLPTEDSRKHARDLLHGLGKHNWQKVFTKLQTAPPNTSISSIVNPDRLSNERVDPFGPRRLFVSAISEAMFSQYIPRTSPKPVSGAKDSSCSPRRVDSTIQYVCLQEALFNTEFPGGSGRTERIRQSSSSLNP